MKVWIAIISVFVLMGWGGEDGNTKQQPCTLQIADHIIFGPPIAVGDSFVVPWSLRNYGDTTQTVVASIESATDSFHWAGGNDTITIKLPPTYNVDQSVVCAPTEAGQLTGSIIASSPNCPELTVTLTCRGT